MSIKKPSLFKRSAAIGLLIVLASVLAFATPTLLSTQVLVQNNAQVTAGQLAVTFAACDNVNGNSFTSTGREILLVQNTDASAHTFSATPVPDPYGGINSTMNPYSVAANSFASVQMKFLIGWQSGGVITLACNSNLIKFAVLQTN
jgi:hypothetical protein